MICSVNNRLSEGVRFPFSDVAAEWEVILCSDSIAHDRRWHSLPSVLPVLSTTRMSTRSITSNTSAF
jgi:hypothetical protein